MVMNQMGEIYTPPPEKKKDIKKAPKFTEEGQFLEDFQLKELYVEGLTNFLRGEIAERRMSASQAEEYVISAGMTYKEKGITSDLPFYRQVLDWKGYAEELNRLRGQPDVWQEFNQRYQQALDVAKKGGARYDRTAGVLLNLVNELGNKVSVDPTAFENLLRKATSDAFSVAAPEEQARLREVPELARAYQRGEVDVFGKLRVTKPVEAAPEYSKIFGRYTAGLGGTENYRSWFESRYPSLLREFDTTREGTKAETEQSWSAYLRTASEKLREQYLKQSPYARGERPAAYASPVKTVGF